MRHRRRILSFAGCVSVLGAALGLFLVNSQRRFEESQYIVYIKGTLLPKRRAESGSWPASLDSVEEDLKSARQDKYARRILTIHEQSTPELRLKTSSDREVQAVIKLNWFLGQYYQIIARLKTPQTTSYTPNAR